MIRLSRIPWPLWLALKYLFGRSQRHRGASLILATCSIAVGVTALICILTAMNGMQNLMISTIDEVTSYHLQIASQDQEPSPELLSYLETVPEIINVTSFLESPMLFSTPARSSNHIAVVRAVEVEAFENDLGRRQIMKVFNPQPQIEGLRGPNAWIGMQNAYQMGFQRGSSIPLLSVGNQPGEPIGMTQKNFPIDALYLLPDRRAEQSYIFIGLNPENQKLFPNTNLYYGIKLRDKQMNARVKNQLLPTLQQLGEYSVQTSFELNRPLFTALHLEKKFLETIVSMIFLVVFFQIYQAMKRSAFERIQELMLARAIGSTPLELRLVFLIESLILGLPGCILGVILGISLSLNLNRILGWLSSLLLERGSELAYIDILILPTDIFLILGSAIFFCTVSGWFSTRPLSRMKPTDVLRNE